MNHTTNLHLPHWEETDRIMMDDFNDAMESIDAGVKAATDAAAAAPHLHFGSYDGDDVYERTISLGFTPSYVLLWEKGGRQCNNDYTYGGICSTNAPCANSDGDVFFIVPNGFLVRYSYAAKMCANKRNCSYYYLAIE